MHVDFLSRTEQKIRRYDTSICNKTYVISNGTCNDVHFVILSIKEDYASVCTVEPRVTDMLGAGILSFVGRLFPSRQGWESGADKPKVVIEHEVIAEIILMPCACLT